MSIIILIINLQGIKNTFFSLSVFVNSNCRSNSRQELTLIGFNWTPKQASDKTF